MRVSTTGSTTLATAWLRSAAHTRPMSERLTPGRTASWMSMRTVGGLSVESCGLSTESSELSVESSLFAVAPCGLSAKSCGVSAESSLFSAESCGLFSVACGLFPEDRPAGAQTALFGGEVVLFSSLSAGFFSVPSSRRKARRPLRVESWRSLPPATTCVTFGWGCCRNRSRTSSRCLGCTTMPISSISSLCSKASMLCSSTVRPATSVNCLGRALPKRLPVPPARMRAMVWGMGRKERFVVAVSENL